ncbi:MAG: hypothetical protein J0M18_00005, partial [Ignavibacteria bacterium]|nr:hypothetical protein [Ignavibacteria bacterium]
AVAIKIILDIGKCLISFSLILFLQYQHFHFSVNDEFLTGFYSSDLPDCKIRAPKSEIFPNLQITAMQKNGIFPISRYRVKFS